MQCQSIVLYTWYLPCQRCAKEIARVLGQYTNTHRVTLVYTSTSQNQERFYTSTSQNQERFYTSTSQNQERFYTSTSQNQERFYTSTSQNQERFYTSTSQNQERCLMMEKAGITVIKRQYSGYLASAGD